MKRKLAITLFFALAFLGAAQAAAAAPFGITGFKGGLRAPGGAAPLHQAGGHPDFTTTLEFAKVTSEAGEAPAGDPKDVDVTLPAGLIGNPTATPKCTQAAMLELKWFANCKPETQVGLATIVTYNGGFGFPTTVPIYNLEPPTGVAGQFAFNVLSTVIFIDANVTASGDYRLQAKVGNASQGLALGDTKIVLWGVPAAPAHDIERVEQAGFSPTGEPVPSEAEPVPLMSNPTECSGTPLRTEARADSWQEPGVFSTAAYDTEEDGTPITIEGCDEVPFEAALLARPTNREGGAPTGLDVTLSVRQNRLPEGLAAAHLRDAVVRLPTGMTLNPSAAGGLGSCSPAQIGIGNDALPSCPDDSKIGTVTVDTPLLEEPLAGSVYVAQQRQNPFGSLLALYIVVADPTTGVLVKIPGKVEADPADGSLVARFSQLPQLPFATLTMHLAGGPRAVLINPTGCGTYSTVGSFAPWSGTGAIALSDSFRIETGPGGGACLGGRFAPSLEGGTADPSAGRFSPFELLIGRDEASERLSSVGVKLPEGLLARLAGVAYCPDATLAAIPTAEGTGAAQLVAPSCPAASRVGTAAVAAGAGPSPLWVKTGSAYLAGPYKGAPVSLATVVPALAGPFDLGNVVVRTALRVDPATAQVSAESDPLPTILDGIPLDLRSIQLTLDRSSFTVNPTSCRAQRIEGTIGSVGGRSASAGEPFGAAGCSGLGFSPSLKLALRGQTGRIGNPALTATLKAGGNQANLARAQVLLPRTMFIDNAHIDDPCTRVQFGEGRCPAKSVLGTATAWSPLLDRPLTGPVYFRSNGGERRLPDLVADLHGQIHITLVGFIDSVKAGKEGSRVRTRFQGLPDAAVSKFVLKLKGGDRGLLQNSVDLCRGPQSAAIRLVGQNGKVRDLTSRIGTSCGGGKPR
jgi:hypothetical protein